MKYYIDLGSSTIKVYRYEDSLNLLEEHSIYFKNDFDSEKGISDTNLEELCNYFSEIQSKYGLRYDNTFIYVTGIFRNLSDNKKVEMLKLFNDKFDLHFNIISHGIEAYYLSKAMEHDYNGKKVLIINMGGKTTELVTYLGDKLTGIKTINVGVADVLNNFDRINEEYSGHSVEEIEEFTFNKLKDLNLDINTKISKMSKGMQEKLQLILVMSRTAELYILDEPLGGVDPATRDYILDTILSNFSDGASVIISTHLISDIERILDEVIFMNNGEIALTSSADELRNSEKSSIDDIFRRYFKC